MCYFTHCRSKDSTVDRSQYQRISEKTEKLDACGSRDSEVCGIAVVHAYSATHTSYVGNARTFFHQGLLTNLTKSVRT